jgi:hypothetical protein
MLSTVHGELFIMWCLDFFEEPTVIEEYQHRRGRQIQRNNGDRNLGRHRPISTMRSQTAASSEHCDGTNPDPKLQTLDLQKLTTSQAFLGYCRTSEVLFGTAQFKDL